MPVVILNIDPLLTEDRPNLNPRLYFAARLAEQPHTA